MELEIKQKIMSLSRSDCDYACQQIHHCNHDEHEDNFLCSAEIEDLFKLLAKDGYGKLIMCPDFKDRCAFTCKHIVDGREQCFNTQGADDQTLDISLIFELIK